MATTRIPAGRIYRRSERAEVSGRACISQADGLSGRIQFKLDKDYKDVKRGYAAAIAARVADEAGCGTKPKRLFRPAGKHEAKHVAAGLDLWYTMDCGADDEALDAHATSGAARATPKRIIQGRVAATPRLGRGSSAGTGSRRRRG